MALLRLINVQGWVGIILATALGALLAIQVGKTDHYSTLAAERYGEWLTEKSAHERDIITWQDKVLEAIRLDAENAARVQREQNAITKERYENFDRRIADARARADSLRRALSEAANHQGGSPAAPVPSLPAGPGGAPQGSGEDGLPDGGLSWSDRLVATEQAIQLDELVKWVKAQHAVEVNGASPQQTRPHSSR